MSLESAFEIGRLYLPLKSLADCTCAEGGRDDPFLYLPGLRGYWPMSSVGTAGQAINLVPGGSPFLMPNEGQYGVMLNQPYVSLDGVDDYLDIADGSEVDIIGTETYIEPAMRGLTLGGWFNVGSLPASRGGIFSKYNTSGNQRGYGLNVNPDDKVAMWVSDDGATYETIESVADVSLGQWLFIVGRFVPGDTVSLFVNGVQANVATTQTAIFNSSSALEVGRWSASDELELMASRLFLCAMALPDDLIRGLLASSGALYGVAT